MTNLKTILTSGCEVDVSNYEHKTLPNRAIKFNKQNYKFKDK